MDVLCEIFKSYVVDIAALVLSSVAFYYSRKENKRKIKEATIHAFDKLKEKFYENGKFCIWDMVYDEPDTIYKKYEENEKAIVEQLGLMEHFAVGINNEIYDIKTLEAMAGKRTTLVWESLKPIIEDRRKLNNDNKKNYYCAFEEMVKRIQK